jgi:hypothetical protein
LSSPLIYTPGFISDNPDARRATNREVRNSLSHSADLIARQSLNEQEFDVKWVSIQGAMDVLMKQLLLSCPLVVQSPDTARGALRSELFRRRKNKCEQRGALPNRARSLESCDKSV